ncbi:ABC transporter ATP-binding protein [Vibrio breoganii]|uniref:ABC transporter ATP-binding protein n=1 Tax=Vibrio breoganii TaxID=553239 RepID=A0AAP8MTJ2_9VIBR|nr:ABC transporter ATP-binding protein [Vibrio breoganii]NMO74597.1 ABC transporter ATP-binding protein [Vibrio breoganii]NMR69909.1 ABC transporter ATP-binding protein [Vibrio breoganii]PMG06732.1 ABC transporter ATP-binding protein [Vibrio breoganii]PMG36592.1 ABC transporter ATP-binding protein [Vibrio breoganii]PMG93488.1 ABC transporter ATP-binding protein [Vibrio breoganii]
MTNPLVQLQNATKQFIDGKETHSVLDAVNFSLNRGESVALTGASGSGKSTLLNVIAGFESLTDGTLLLNGIDAKTWHDPQWSLFRHQQLGVVFQQFNLLTPLNVAQNIAFPLSLSKQKWNPWCDHLVAKLEIDTLLSRHVASLSGGQQQRVAIARALAHKPSLLLADEPTGNLDQKAGLEVMQLLTEIASEGDCAIALVTHSLECAEFMQQGFHLANGQLHESQ